MDKNQILDWIATENPEEIAKAVREALGLSGIRIIKDLWSDGEFHKLPERNDIKTGPAMHMSGAGPDKAIAEYSNPAPQVGLTQAYDEFTQKNVEGWGKMHEAFKGLGEDIKTGFGALLEAVKANGELKALKKDPDPDPDPDPKMKKDPDPDPDPDPKSKAEIVSALWNNLADLEEAYAKAEISIEKADADGMKEVREHIEKAEGCVEAIEEHEDRHHSAKESMKAQVLINLGWRYLMKATGLNSYDLKGYGNQADSSVPGDSTDDQSKHDVKKAEAKAKYYTMKAQQLGSNIAISTKKADEKEEKEEKEHGFDMKKDPDPDPDPDPKSKANLEAEIADLKKASEQQTKLFAERIAEINKRIETSTGNKAPTMVPVIIKSVGIKSDDVVGVLNAKIEKAQEEGSLTEEYAGMARSIVQQYLAAGRGAGLTVNTVNARLTRAPMEVRAFFDQLEASA